MLLLQNQRRAISLKAVATVILVVSVTIVCSASRISSTYVAFGTNFTEMLQLTQTDNGQISGVVSYVAIKSSGQISSDQAPITGAIDADQLTLKPASGLLQFFGAGGIAGTVKGNTITLQIVASKGVVSSRVFTRSSAEDFKRYADQLRSRAAAIELNRKLRDGAKQFHDTVQSAERWVANAELHAKRIPAVEERYRQIEGNMQSLVVRGRGTPDSVTRSQISVAVDQGDNAGGEVDNQVNYLWDMEIEQSGNELYQTFNNWNGNCGTANELRERQKQGALPQILDQWESACKLAFAEREKFVPAYKRIMEQRQQLKLFQATAQAHRRALVEEAQRFD